jgi:hypothetical protein
MLAESAPQFVNRRHRLLQGQHKPAQLLRYVPRSGFVVRHLAPTRIGRLNEKGGSRLAAQHIDLKRLDLPRETVETAGQNDMPAGEPAHQPVHFGERIGRVDIVEDQQPAWISCQPREYRVKPHLLLGRRAFGQLQRPARPARLRRNSSGESACANKRAV